MKIHRRKNNSISNDPCALCGDRTDPTGFDPLTDDHRLVCERCAAIVGVPPAPGSAAERIEWCRVWGVDLWDKSVTRSASDADILGGCSDCGDVDGYVNAGRTHRAYCLAHKTSWIVGSNLFSGWQDETEDEQRAKWDGVFTDDQWRGRGRGLVCRPAAFDVQRHPVALDHHGRANCRRPPAVRFHRVGLDRPGDRRRLGGLPTRRANDRRPGRTCRRGAVLMEPTSRASLGYLDAGGARRP